MKTQLFEDQAFIKKVLKISIPVILQQLLLTTFNIVDTVMVGSIYRGVASVGLAGQLMMIVMMIVFGINSGIALFIAQYYGAENEAKMRKAFALMTFFVFLVSLVFTLIGWVFPRQILELFNKDPEVVEPAIAYLQIAVFSIIPNMVSFAFAMTYRNIQKTKIPLLISAVAMLVNVTFNYLFIFGYGPFPRLGVQGAAVGTLIATTVGLIIYIVYTKLSNQMFWPTIKDYVLCLQPKFIQPIARRVVPLVINEAFFGVGMALYIVIYNQLGSDAYEGYRIAESISNLLFIFVIGLGSSVSAIIGQELGKNDFVQAKTYADKFFKLGIVVAIFIGLITILFARALVSVFQIQDESINNIAVMVLYVFGVRIALRIFTAIIFSIFRAGGKSRFLMFLDGGVVWLIGLPMAFIG